MSATVSDPEGYVRCTCTIRDISLTGCKLVSTSVGKLPDAIRIVADGVAQPIFGQVVWRSGRMAGVRLEWPDQARLSIEEADWLDLNADHQVDRRGGMGLSARGREARRVGTHPKGEGMS